MRWLKHLANSWNDERVAALIGKGGKDGLALYGAYWRVQEILAAQMDGSDPSCAVQYSVSRWSVLMSVRGSHVSHYLGQLAQKGLVTVDWIGTDIRVTNRKLLKYRDEYSRKSGHEQERVRKRTEQIESRGREKEITTHAEMSSAPSAASPAVVIPTPQLQPQEVGPSVRAGASALPDSVDARILCEQVGIFKIREQEAMHRCFLAFCGSSGMSVETAMERMISRWREYQQSAPQLEWQWGSAHSFFMSGKWDQPDSWPRGKQAQLEAQYEQFLKEAQ